MTKEDGWCVRVCVCARAMCGSCLCVHLRACMFSGCRTVTAVTQPQSQGGEMDRKGRVGERGGENSGVA